MKIKKYETRINKKGSVMLSECGYYVADGRKKYDNPLLLADFFGDTVGIKQAAEEHLYCVCLDTRLHMIGCFEASHGSVNTSMFPVREILQKALMLGAVFIAICHNHPAGDLFPSGADVSSTSKLKDACDVVGLGLIDHIIVGANTAGFYSFHDSGLVPGPGL